MKKCILYIYIYKMKALKIENEDQTNKKDKLKLFDEEISNEISNEI